MKEKQDSLKKRETSVRRWLYGLLGLIITIVFLVWALRGVSPGVVWQAVQQSQGEWVLLGLITFISSFSIRARRWGTLLGAHHDPGSFKIRQSAVFIGFAGNAILPAHAGEVIRSLILHRFGGVPLGAALGSIFAERLLDAVVAFLLLLIALLSVTQASHLGAVQPGNFSSLPVGWIALVLAIACVIFLSAARWPLAIAEFVGKVSRVVGLGRHAPRIEAIVRSLLSGLEALRYPQRGIMAVMESFCIWGMTGMTYWFLMLAFGINTPGPMGALFVQGVVALAIAIPSSPGYLGPFEAAIRFGLGLYAIPPDAIVAFAITLRILMFFSLTAIGFFLATRLGLSWHDFIQSKNDQKAGFFTKSGSG